MLISQSIYINFNFKLISIIHVSFRLINSGLSKYFDYVFVDESGQATETETLIPVSGLLKHSTESKGQLILVGDPKQLGPIIHSPIAKEYGFGKLFVFL